MTQFAGLITATIVSIAFFVTIVAVLRVRLRWFAETRTRRAVVGGFLFVCEAVVGVILSSIDFGVAVKGEAFTEQDLPLLPFLVGLIGFGAGLQTMIVLHDDFAETERSVYEKELAAARRDRSFVTLLSKMILKAVSRKRDKLCSIDKKEDLPAALDPKPAIAALVQGSWHVFDQMGPLERPSNFRLRVAYYRRGPGGLTLTHAWNGTDPDCVPWTEDVRKRFRSDHPQGCLALAASRTGDIMLVRDTVAADDDRQHPFWFFETPNESDSLKSIAALPIKLDGTKGPYNVLVVDTNLEAFFNASDQRQVLELEQVVVNLAQRLQLEERMGTLLGEAA